MEPISVSKLTEHIVALFQADDLLRSVVVLGEISNWKRAASGHIYFSVKDESSSINAVMWRGNAAGQTWLPKDGDQVLATGYVDVYPDRGVYQLYVSRIQPAGRGVLYAQFEAVKRRLQMAGLFDEERKRLVPSDVRTVGVVTSADAAALRDICRVLHARWPLVDVVVFPTLVQGSEAPAKIVAAIQSAAEYSRLYSPVDVLIVARGGGSMEDLWAFNDEQVAYAIAESPVPVVSGIGHETDFTIADFVADVRAPTPSAAAAAVIPDKREVQSLLTGIVNVMASHLVDRIERSRQQLASQQHRLRVAHPQRMLDQRRQMLDDRERRLNGVMANSLVRMRIQTESVRQKLAVMNPQHVLNRGYSIVTNKNGRVITNPQGLSVDDQLRVQAAKGRYAVRVDALE